MAKLIKFGEVLLDRLELSWWSCALDGMGGYHWWWSLLCCLSVKFDQLSLRLYIHLGRYQCLLVVPFMLSFTKFYCTSVVLSYLNSYCISLRLTSLYGFLPSPIQTSHSHVGRGIIHTTLFAISDVAHPMKWEPSYLKAGCSGTVKTCTLSCCISIGPTLVVLIKLL